MPLWCGPACLTQPPPERTIIGARELPVAHVTQLRAAWSTIWPAASKRKSESIRSEIARQPLAEARWPPQ